MASVKKSSSFISKRPLFEIKNRRGFGTLVIVLMYSRKCFTVSISMIRVYCSSYGSLAHKRTKIYIFNYKFLFTNAFLSLSHTLFSTLFDLSHTFLRLSSALFRIFSALFRILCLHFKTTGF